MALSRETLLLASGLSLLKANSFSRQFLLLRRFLEEAGFRVHSAGRAPSGEISGSAAALPSGGAFDIAEFTKEVIEGLCSRLGITRIILIGYPDQFRFLRDGIQTPVFFWYQSSKPSFPPWLESTTIVPLTGMTADHLKAADFRRIAPVIPHGVDTRVFVPRRLRRTGVFRSGGSPAGEVRRKVARRPVLLTVGANSRRKRFDRLMDVFELITEKIPEATLIIKTDSVNKPGGFDLKRLADRPGVSNRVTIIDTDLSDPALASLYASSDIYIHTAEWEGFGIPVIEAMASGLPVVTHQVQGPGELVPYPDLLVRGSRIIHDGEVVLMEADPQSFADGVIRFVTEPSLLRRAAAEGRRAAVNRFDIRIVAKQWSRLLLGT